MKEEQIFHQALERPADRRDAWLDDACGDDAALRERVNVLLRANANPGSFLGAPAPELVATREQPPLTEPPGTQIGPYKLREQIGEGGFGVVYVAEQEKPVARKVALKIIKPGMDTREIIARFEAERQALALMDHPNIAKVLDAGTTGGNPKSESRNPKQTQKRKSESQRPDDNDVSDIRNSNLEFPSDFEFRDSNFRSEGRPYFVMELVRGVPITEFCDERKLSTRERLQLFIDVCRAVQHAHQKGIIHRDIKPSNVMVTLRDDKPIPKVIDFGVSKALSSKLTEKTIYTAYGQMIGTPLYMSPEQAQMNEIDVDTRSDVYSLGVLLYELLTGTTPFDKETLQKSGFDEMRRIIREVDPPRPSARISTLRAEMLSTVSDKRKIDPHKLGASLRGELDWIVMKALEKDRNRRYESASGLAADVERYLSDEPVQACPPSVWYLLRKFARKNRTAAAMTSLVSLLLIAVAINGYVIAERTKETADRDWRLARQKLEVNQQLSDALESLRRLRERAERAGVEDADIWSKVEKTAERTRTLLKSDLALPALVERARKILAALDATDRGRRMVRRLENIRLERAATDSANNNFASRRAIPEYKATFEDFGISEQTLTPAKAAEMLQNSTPSLRRSLIAGLDEWCRLEKVFRTHSSESRRRCEWIVDVITRIDTDPWRKQVRQAIKEQDFSALRSLAKTVDIAAQPPQILVVVGNALFRNRNDHDAAILLLKRARLRYPNDFWINQTLGRMYGRTTPPRHEQSIRHFWAAVSIRPKSACPWVNLGNALARNGELDEAISAQRKAIELAPKLAFAHFNLGKVLSLQKKLDEAVACYRKAIELEPKLASAYVNLGIALHNQKKPDEAVACYRKAIELDPKLAMAHNNLGIALREQKKLDEAVASYRKAIELDPKLAIAHCNLGVALRGQNKLDEAVASFRKAIELNPKYASAHYNIGVFLFQQKKLDEAVASYRQAIELNPKYAQAYINLGIALDRQGKPDEAVACFRQAIIFNPKYAHAYINLGAALYSQNKLDAAVACYRKVIELEPKFATAHYNLGRAFNAQKKMDLAIACYRKAIQLDPKRAGAHNNLGITLHDQNKLDEAIACYRKAIELEPKNARYRTNLANSLRRQKQIAEVARWRKVSQLEPKNAIAHDQLGAALDTLGRREEAIACYRKAFEIDPARFRNLAPALERKGDWNGVIAVYRRAIAAKRDVYLYLRLGRASRTARQWGQAIAAYREAIRLAPTKSRDRRTLASTPTAHSELAWLLATCPEPKLRNADEAVKHAGIAIQVDPKGGEGWRALGAARYRRGDWNGALAALRRASRRFDGDAKVSFFLAMAHWQRGERKRAGLWYDRAVQRVPFVASWSYPYLPEELSRLRAEAAQLLGVKKSPGLSPGQLNLEKAFVSAAKLLLADDIAGYRRSCARLLEHGARLKCENQPWRKHYLLARVCVLAPAATADPAEPAWLANVALRRGSRTAWHLHTVGLAHYRNGRYADAVTSFEQSLRASPDWSGRSVNWLGLAMSHHALSVMAVVSAPGNPVGEVFMYRESVSQAQKAREWLREATVAIDADRRKRPRSKTALGMHIHDWVACQVLRREAEQLIKGSAK
jgi:eukaryotic-like serine/threonine-protein kinase